MKEGRSPKKRTRLPLKNSIQKEVSGKIPVSTESDLPQIDSLIKQALKEMAADQRGKITKFRKTKDNMEAMVNVCSEFMQSFIIMGYDMKHNPIEPIFYANTQLEADALSNYIQMFIVDSLKGNNY